MHFWSRMVLPAPSLVPLTLSILGVVGIGVGGWLGAEMVHDKGMAVEKLAKKVEERPRLRRAS